VENDLMDVIREIGGDLIEDVVCKDTFKSPKENKTSKYYEINYRSLERTLTNEEIDKLQFAIRDAIEAKLGLKLR